MRTYQTTAVCAALAAWSSASRADPGQGDVYVLTSNGGGAIFLDGETTGVTAPGVVKGVPAGTHTIRVDEGCRSATADLSVRTNAVERVELTLAPGSGTLTVAATPITARILEDGQQLGVGGFGPVTVACGSHTLVAMADGHDTLTYTVEVKLRGVSELRMDLPPAALGAVAITPTPIDARVFVDGKDRGAGPMTVEGLSVGTHTVEVRKDGYVVARQTVDVVAHEIARSSVTLLAKPPPVRLPGARIALDSGVTAVAMGLGAATIVEYRAAADAYTEYAQLTYADDPDGWYDANVVPPKTLSVAFGIGAGVAAVGAAALWITTTPEPAPGHAAVQVLPAPNGLVLLGAF